MGKDALHFKNLGTLARRPWRLRHACCPPLGFMSISRRLFFAARTDVQVKAQVCVRSQTSCAFGLIKYRGCCALAL